MVSAFLEDYLLALYTISEERGEPVKTTDIAEWLKISPASVTEMIQKMGQEGYVNYTPYKGATFTERGRNAAVRIVRRHCIAERFLTDVVGMEVEKVHEHAHKLEHGFTDFVEQEICRLLKHPEYCPDDAIPIPKCFKPMTCEECIAEGDWVLTNLDDGQEAIISHMATGDKEEVRRLISMGFKPGRTVTMKARLDDSLLVGLDNVSLALSKEMASMVHVSNPHQKISSMIPDL